MKVVFDGPVASYDFGEGCGREHAGGDIGSPGSGGRPDAIAFRSGSTVSLVLPVWSGVGADHAAARAHHPGTERPRLSLWWPQYPSKRPCRAATVASAMGQEETSVWLAFCFGTIAIHLRHGHKRSIQAQWLEVLPEKRRRTEIAAL